MSVSDQDRSTAMAGIADFIVRMRWVWLVVALGLVALSVARLDRIWPPNPDARIFFDEKNPDRVALDKFEATFNKNENLMIVIAPEGGDVFDPRILKLIGEITEKAWLLPFVRRVDSLTNFQHTEAEGDEMITRDLVEDPANTSPEDAEIARKVALDRIELVNQTVSPKGDVTMVQVLFTLPQKDPITEVPSIVAEMKAMQAEIAKTHPDVKLHLSGGVMINNQFAVSGQQDAQTLMGPMFLIILLVVGFAIRSILGTLSVLVIIILSALGGLGASNIYAS